MIFDNHQITNKIELYNYMTVRKITLLLVLTIIVLSADPYKTKLASRLTHYAAIAYQSQALIQSWTCEFCKSIPFESVKVVSNDSNSVYGFVGFSPEYQSIVIAFRGSVDTANWILNLKTTRTSTDLCDGCSVHVGFNQGFNSVKSQVDVHIQFLLAQYRENKFMITGHSLGGALAVMAAAYIQKVHSTVAQLYTMGQPRVGNDKFATFMSTFIPNTYRIVHFADQVPHVPQSILGFKHEGFEIWYERGMQSYTICPSESKDCSNQFNVFQVTQADHKMILYLELKVQSSFSFGSIFNRLKFYWVDFTTGGKTYNLDMDTMLEEDRQIKQSKGMSIIQD